MDFQKSPITLCPILKKGTNDKITFKWSKTFYTFRAIINRLDFRKTNQIICDQALRIRSRHEPCCNDRA